MQGARNGTFCKRETQWYPLQKGRAMECFVEQTHNGVFCKRARQCNLLRKGETMGSCVKGTHEGILCRREAQFEKEWASFLPMRTGVKIYRGMSGQLRTGVETYDIYDW